MADSNKTERATPRHRQKARERGQVTRSRELSSALSMSAIAGVLFLIGRNAIPHWTHYFRTMLELASSESIEPGGPVLYWTTVEVLRWMVPILACGFVVSLACGLAQGGFVFAPESLASKFERLSPGARSASCVSLAALSTILKSLFPSPQSLWIGYACIRGHWGEILGSSYTDARHFAGLVSGMLLEVCWKSGLVLLAWSGVDYLLLWRKNEGDLKMSRQDIKDEYKQSEGNPANKARIRRLQRQARRGRMLKATETATVVITNPTHYAVALRYEANMAAPVVVAKGLTSGRQDQGSRLETRHPRDGKQAARPGALQDRRGGRSHSSRALPCRRRDPCSRL